MAEIGTPMQFLNTPMWFLKIPMWFPIFGYPGNFWIGSNDFWIYFLDNF